MPEKKNSFWGAALIVLTLSACSTEKDHPQFAQRAHAPIVQNEVMTETCREQAAYRYNTREQEIKVLGLRQYQGSVEIKGHTARQEGFTCSFDENGHFLHLSSI